MKHRKIAQRLSAWFAANARDLPWRLTRDPYAIWVSEIMLQQTQVKTVLPYWKRWMENLPDIAALAKAPPGRIHKLWEGLGYYTRVRNMQKAAKRIIADQGGTFPHRFEDVLELPGVGRYTAGAICSIAFNQPHPILDGNVIRVLTRLFGISGNPREPETNRALWRLADRLVQQAHKTDGASNRKGRRTVSRSCANLNQALMELGALVCTPRQPQCEPCPVRSLCVARRQNRVQELPHRGQRTPSTARRFVAFVLQRRGRLLVRQRPAGTVNAHLWELPNIEIGSAETNLNRAAQQALGAMPALFEPVCSLKHTITRYRITLEVFRAEVPALPAHTDGRWVEFKALARLPFTSAHKKVLQQLEFA